jgi:GT2 family glycosyltransferase
MKSYTHLTIIIPTFYPGKIIDECLDTIPKTADIIIVDNGKDIELENILNKKEHNIRHFKIGDVGLPKSFNYGVSKSKNENILITQPDVRFRENAIDNLLNASSKYNDAGILAPIIHENDVYSSSNSMSLSLDKKGELLNGSKFKGTEVLPEGDFCVEAVNATAMLVKKSILNKINGWDEKIFTYLEDIDLCLNLRRNGYQIIKINNAIVDHTGFGSHKKENINKAELSRNWHFIWSSLYFANKHYSKAKFITFFFRNFFKYLTKTILNLLLFKKKKYVLNFMRLRACINYLLIRKSNYRVKM